jgi:hypothetical protein
MAAYIVNVRRLTIHNGDKLEFQASSNQELDLVVKMMVLGKNDTLKFIVF